MAARRRSRQEWKRIVLEWRQSGLTKAQFARRHGLNPTTFALSEGGLGGGAAASAAPACTRLFHRRTHGSAAVLPASHRRLDRRVSPYRVLAGFRSSRRCRSRCCPARARTATREVRQIAVRRERRRTTRHRKMQRLAARCATGRAAAATRYASESSYAQPLVPAGGTGTEPDRTAHPIAHRRERHRARRRERDARELRIVGGRQHLALRKKRSAPAMQQIHAWLQQEQPRHLPKSKMGDAIGYRILSAAFVRGVADLPARASAGDLRLFLDRRQMGHDAHFAFFVDQSGVFAAGRIILARESRHERGSQPLSTSPRTCHAGSALRWMPPITGAP